MVFHRKLNSSTKTTTIHERRKVLKKSKSLPPRLNDPKRSANGSLVGALKSGIKEMGPICKRRKKYEKDSPASKQLAEEDADFDWVFNKVLSQQDSLWLSSESLSPLYNVGDFRFMSPRDYSIDERLVSLLSSWVDFRLFRDKRVNFFDGAKANPIKEASLARMNVLPQITKEEAERWLVDPVECTIDSSCAKSCSGFSASQDNSLAALGASSFWDSNRTDMWVSLINLEGEDSKLISSVESECENLESDFPSPSYKMNSVTDIDVSSRMRSAHDELSSELLSGSVDLDEMNFDEPLMWPFGDWSSTLEFFCESPHRGLGASSAFLLKNDGKKGHPKALWKRRIVVASGLNASKIVEFKRGSRRIAIASRNTKFNLSRANNRSAGKKQKLGGKDNHLMSAKRLGTMSLVGMEEFNWRTCGGPSCSSSMDFDASGWSVSLINLNGEDSECISDMEEGLGLNSNFPSPSYKNQESQGNSSAETKTSACFHDDVLCGFTNWDQMDADEPLFWPYGNDHDWSMALDNFNVSPRKGNVLVNRSSIRVRIHDQREGFRRGLIGVAGLNASKIVGFKRVHNKKNGSGRRVNGKMNSRSGRSGRRCPGTCVPQKMDVIMENEGEEGAAAESMLGLGEFDGHEGIDMQFQIHNFSILDE